MRVIIVSRLEKKMDTFLKLLVFLYLAGGSSADCTTSNDGSCTWIDANACNSPKFYCGEEAECLVVTKSLNSSYWLESSSASNQQFECRCPVGATTNCKNPALKCTSHRPTDSFVKISVDNMPTNSSMSVVYAEMWRCPIGDNSAIQCPSGKMRIGNELGCNSAAQMLPNVFALVRFWCQFKINACEFDSSLILSHVGQSLAQPETLPGNYVFESSVVTDQQKTFQCPAQSVMDSGTCYRMTPMNLEWKAARSHCLQLGGDLAHFTNYADFASILRRLDNTIPTNLTSLTAIPTWFKFFTWTGEQRTPQHFLQYTDGFQCDVYNLQRDVGANPHSRCKFGARLKKIRGLCVLPPILPSENFNYEKLSCPVKCDVSGYTGYCWEAEADTKVSASCPNGLSGFATWTCGIDGKWTTPSPDQSNCTNPIVEDSINQANKNITNGGNPSESLNGISTVLKENEMATANIVQLDMTVRLAIEKQTELLSASTDVNSKDASSKNFTNSIVDVNNELLTNDLAFWGLDPISRSEAIDQVQKNIDDTLFLLADNLLDQLYKQVYPNIAVQVERKINADYKNQTYTYVTGDKDQLILPAGFPYAVDDTETRLSFATYNAFQNLLYGDTLVQLSAENETTFEPIGQVVVSKVLGATLGQPNGSIHFVDGKVEILLSTLNLDRYEVNKTTATCVFWDTLTQEWSSDGCEVVETNDKSSTRCRCNHLTNFAVLMDINGVFKEKTTSPLDYITVIGESISIACLTLAIVIFYWVRTLRRDFRFVIHRNLCANLLIAEILLLVGMDATTNSDLCLSIAVFIHFFFLCAFSWMFVEGLYLYFLITKVFDGSGLKQWQYYVIGYGLPTLVVAITLGATNTNAYSTSPYCWLSYENGAIWAFAGPVAAIIFINLVFLTVAISVSFKSRRNAAEKKEKKNNFRWIYGTISLTFILGITWVFGFLFFGQGSLIFAYIFTILNSLQGLFIFITFCVINKKVRKDLRRQFITSQRIQRVALYFNVELSDLHTIPSQNKSGTYDVHQRVTNSSSNNHSQVSVLSNRLY
ncbi:adhesion G protein-coupled receptor L3-like [Daphnia pulex]|uniref:adhesion G protein-coupled receptor L3-like n=1 Tax=Daphnia pulex TaxID=6669 RepID=UPI001EDEBF51|nr:adhesion G protein-coupled receptor L3-like [Daphnia pulex]XP_046446438.1 adhesion G protein-coupled receptor L3-like [Daphnia pulex]